MPSRCIAFPGLWNSQATCLPRLVDPAFELFRFCLSSMQQGSFFLSYKNIHYHASCAPAACLFAADLLTAPTPHARSTVRGYAVWLMSVQRASRDQKGEQDNQAHWKEGIQANTVVGAAQVRARRHSTPRESGSSSGRPAVGGRAWPGRREAAHCVKNTNGREQARQEGRRGQRRGHRPGKSGGLRWSSGSTSASGSKYAASAALRCVAPAGRHGRESRHGDAAEWAASAQPEL